MAAEDSATDTISVDSDNLSLEMETEESEVSQEETEESESEEPEESEDEESEGTDEGESEEEEEEEEEPEETKKKPAKKPKAEPKEEKVEEETEKYDNDFEVEIETKDGDRVEKQTLPLQRLVQAYNLEKASHRRFEEASNRQKAVDSAMRYFREDPLRALEEMLTHDFGGTSEAKQKAKRYKDALVKNHYRAIEEVEKLPPEERERRQLASEIAELRNEKARLAAESLEAEREAAVESFTQKRGKEIRGALTALSERFKGARIAVDTDLARRVDLLMWDWKDKGVEISAQDAAEEILREREYALERYLLTASPEEIASRWPDVQKRNGKEILKTQKLKEADEIEADSVPQKDRKARKKRPSSGSFGSWKELMDDIKRH